MSENNSEFESNSVEEMQTNVEETSQEEQPSASTSQQALKQLNQLSGTSGGTIKTTTIPTSAIQKIDQKLAISGGTKIVYIKNANGAPSTFRIGNQILSTSGQSVVSANTSINATNAANPNIRKVQLVPLKNKNVVTTNNPQRIVLKGATLLPSGVKTAAGGTTTRTLTMSQAQQMGLITTSINKSNPASSTNTTPSTTKTILMPAAPNAGTTQIAVKNNQPTILNKGVKPLQSKVVIQSDSGDSETKPKTIQAHNLLKVTGHQVRAVNVPGKGLQYVRVLSTLPAAGNTANSSATKVVNGGRQPQVLQQKKVLPLTVQQTTQAGNAVAKQFITRKLEVLPIGSGTKIIKKEPILNQNKVSGTFLLNNVQKNVASSTIDVKPIASNQSESFEITESSKIEPPSPTGSQSKFVQRTYSSSNERRSKSPDGNHSNVLYSTLKLPSPEPIDGIRRKHCNCTKSQCLKLYCDCFANGEFCSNCNCKECFNTLEKEDERQKAIKMCLERNPHAFKPKIGKARDQSDTLRRHTKGCNCKRSGCLKNYCECYEAKIVCSANCKCLGCRNIDDHMENNDRDGSQFDLNQTVKRTYSQLDEKIKTEPVIPPKKPCNFITPDVIEATVQCIIAQADDCTKNSCDVKTSERKILEEFGRCLVEIIEFSKKNNDNPDD